MLRLLDISKSRHPAAWIGCVLGTGIALSLAAFLTVRGWQRADWEKRSAEVVRNHVDKLQLSILRSMEVLHSIAALHAVEGGISRENFHSFVQSALRRQPELQALSWNPVVPAQERSAFEAKAAASGLDSFVIRERSASGQLVYAGANEHYVPIYWIEPLEPNAFALGFDLNSDSLRRKFLLEAKDSGHPTATSPIGLAQSDNSPGFLVIQPVFRRGANPESVAARQSQLEGYAVAVFSVSNLVASVLNELHQQGIESRLLDESAHGQFIYGSPVLRAMDSVSLDVAGRNWVLSYASSQHFSAEWQAWLIFLAAVAFTFLATAYLYGGWRSSREIAQANHALRQEIIVRQRAEAEAASANNAKSDFLASMSHEIRTPLNAILGYGQLMQRDAQLSPEQRDSLNGITVSGQHLLSLINEILDLSKIEAGRAELHPTDFDLLMLARSLETTFKPLCAQQRIQFSTCIHDEGNVRVQGDEGKLRQVLINLIGNAVKFTRVGEVTLNVRCHGQDRWLFEVIDTGLGIPPEEQAHIFKPFHQGAGAQHLGGTGLGLAIAQRQVQLLGGELQLDSDRGAGSRFHFKIPLAAAAVQEAKPASGFAKLSAGQHFSALVVDDRKENRDVLGGMLTAIGGKVLFAMDGDEAIATLRREAFDVVFLDWLMAGISRSDLVQALFSEQRSRPVIIAHSASILPGHREEALAAGCAEFLVKPLSWSSVCQALDHHVGIKFEHDSPLESEPSMTRSFHVKLPEELCARLAVAAELHSTTALKAALRDLRELGPDACALAEQIRQHMRSYDMHAIQRLLADIGTFPDAENATPAHSQPS